MAGARWCGCGVRFHFGYAIAGILIGLSAAPMFGIMYHNYSATSFALISSVFAAVLTVVHYKWMKARITSEHAQILKLLMYTGCFGQLLGLLAFVAFLTAGGVLGQGLTGDWLKGENYWISSVWGWMTWKWAFQLFWWSRIYRRSIVGGTLKYSEIITNSESTTLLPRK